MPNNSNTLKAFILSMKEAAVVLVLILVKYLSK